MCGGRWFTPQDTSSLRCYPEPARRHNLDRPPQACRTICDQPTTNPALTNTPRGLQHPPTSSLKPLLLTNCSQPRHQHIVSLRGTNTHSVGVLLDTQNRACPWSRIACRQMEVPPALVNSTAMSQTAPAYQVQRHRM